MAAPEQRLANVLDTGTAKLVVTETELPQGHVVGQPRGKKFGRLAVNTA